MAKLNVDFSKVEASAGPVVLPTGWQNVLMTEATIDPTSNNATTGNEAVNYKIKVIDGPYANTVLFGNFNLKNQSQQATDIGHAQMKALNEALGIPENDDTDMWLNKPFKVYIKFVPAEIKPATGDQPEKRYDEKNKITGFKNINDTSVEVNHSARAKSGGQSVQLSADFAKGGSPVPAVGATFDPNAASAGLSAVMNATTAPAAPANAPAAPAASAAMVKKYRMTAKANGATAEAFRAHDKNWTDELLIKEGYMEEYEEPAPAAPSVPTTPAVPAGAPAVPAAGDDTPPWLKGKL